MYDESKTVENSSIDIQALKVLVQSKQLTHAETSELAQQKGLDPVESEELATRVHSE